MANTLKMAQIDTIRTLLKRGWSRRRIARELGMHRETVNRYARLFEEENSKPAKVTPGSVSPSYADDVKFRGFSVAEAP